MDQVARETSRSFFEKRKWGGFETRPYLFSAILLLSRVDCEVG